MSLENIKLLREKSGAGMVDCKNALDEAGGDMEKAIEILRKKGITKAAKRANREANEGVIKVGTDDNGGKGYILEINSETDFVARNESFNKLADEIFNIIKTIEPKSAEELLALPMADGQSVKENIENMSGVTGEKLSFNRFGMVSAGSVSAYSHAGGRIGVLVGLNETGKKELAYDIAMHIAAANPAYIRPEDVPADILDKEKEIYAEQLKKEGKPAEMIDKIMGGKLSKFYEDVCLVKQEYIKDDKKKVEDVLGSVSVTGFMRYSL